MPIDTEPSVEDVVLGVCYSAIAAARRQSDFVGWERPLLKIPRDAYDTKRSWQLSDSRHVFN